MPSLLNPEQEWFSVPVSLKDGTVLDGKFLVDDQSRGTRLVLSFGDRSITKEALDTFEALRQIRRELGAEGIQVFCYGACKDVWPSGMSRSMCGGVKAFRHQLGLQSTEMVHILESGPDVVPTSVEEQQLYYEEWLRSIGINKDDKYNIPVSVRLNQNRWFLYLLLGLFLFLWVIARSL